MKFKQLQALSMKKEDLQSAGFPRFFTRVLVTFSSRLLS